MEIPYRRLIRAVLISFLIGTFLPEFILAQDVSTPAETAHDGSHRPRIGLALSGGAALGLSEIGIIRWMEENHIPVDRIAGTSMGAIIGAMYATGMSPTDIQKFAAEIDWEQAFSPEPAYKQISFRRKQDRRDYLINAPLGLKHGLRGPNGFNSGQGAGLLLDRIAFANSEIPSFDDLPIPFRCVATDMQTGEAVVLHDGYLGQAVRASMAIPGVFTPVEFKGRVLADGGLVQNIPVETVKSMDVDVVIAVELQLPPGDAGQLGTLVGVLSRAVDVMITQNEHHSLSLANATVAVDMQGFTINDYNRLDDLVASGYKSAASQSSALLPYAIKDKDEWNRYLSEREARKYKRVKAVEKIEVTGATSDVNERIEGRLQKDVGQPLDLPHLENQLT